MLDSRRKTQFYIEYRVSKHKMTILKKNWGHGPVGPLWLGLWIRVPMPKLVESR